MTISVCPLTFVILGLTLQASILYAIEEGKTIFYNIQNFLRFQLSTSISALSLILISTFLGLPSPMNATQILWISVLYSIFNFSDLIR